MGCFTVLFPCYQSPIAHRKDHVMNSMNSMTARFSQLGQRMHRARERLRDQAVYLFVRTRVGVQSVLEAQKAAGSVTAEYAVILIAATGFAGVLALILKSPEVKAQLTALITRGLKAA
jgi:hypothetical protein